MPAADLARVLDDISRSEAGLAASPAASRELEVEIAAGSRLGGGKLREIADPSALSCPDCHGVLSELRD